METPMVGSPTAPDIYLVLDDLGGSCGRAWRETMEADTERRALIRDLLDGQYANPARIVAFNTAAGWSRDVTQEIASEVRERCAERGEVPRSLDDFLEAQRCR
jgi:hypothetical protein